MARRSGITLADADIPVILGMVARDDRSHDIAAWFGVNQGRIKETKDGKYGLPPLAAANSLPPKGPPGLKGRRLRESINDLAEAMKVEGANPKHLKMLLDAAEVYDADER